MRYSTVRSAFGRMACLPVGLLAAADPAAILKNYLKEGEVPQAAHVYFV
jgi:hypothetical protein